MARSVADLALLWTLVERRLHPERAADLARRSEAIVAGEWRPQARSLGDSATRNRGCPDQRRGRTGNSFVQRHGWAPPRLAVIEEYFFQESEASALDAFKACIARLEEAGAAIERLALPASFAGMPASHRMVMAVEAAQVHREDFATRPETYRPGITRLIEEGLSASAVDYRAARVQQQRFAADLAAAPRCVGRAGGAGGASGAGGTGHRLVPGDGIERAAARRTEHREPAVQLGLVVQRAADVRGAGLPGCGRTAAGPATRHGSRIPRAVPGRGLVRGGPGVFRWGLSVMSRRRRRVLPQQAYRYRRRVLPRNAHTSHRRTVPRRPRNDPRPRS